MESIKSSIDLMFEEYNSDQPKIVPKKLSYDFLNNSNDKSKDLESKQSAKKRKYSDGEYDGSSTNVPKNDSVSSLNTSTSFISPSWETKLLKADLADAQARVSQLKSEIEQQNTIQQHIEFKYSQKEQSLEKELSHNKNKVQELEKIVSKMRKKEFAAKDEVNKIKQQMTVLKQHCDDKVYQIQCEKRKIESDLRFENNQLSNELSELQRHNDDLEMRFESVRKELGTLKDSNAELRVRASKGDAIKNELDDEKQKLQSALSKIKKLEFEIESYGDWKELSKASHSRMSNYSEQEKELMRLRQDVKNLRDSLGNKMLLEEQVHDLKSRLEHYENSSIDGISLQVKLEAVTKELDEWKKVGQDYCPKNLQVNPINLRSHIEKLFGAQLLLSNEKSSAVGEKSSMSIKFADVKLLNDQFQKQIESLKKNLKQYQTIIYRLQKKVQLITGERDSLKLLLDNYEKDLTITQMQSNSQHDQQTKIRMEMLEKSVTAYKELNAKLEQELKEVKEERGDPDPNDEGLFSINHEQFDNLRKELNALKVENEKLNKRRKELEIENENLRLRTAFDDTVQGKVVHFANNPADMAYENHKNEIDKLKADIERLKIRNRKLEEGNVELTSRLNETMNMTMNIKEVGQLKANIQTLEAKLQHVKEVYKKSNMDFRDVCCLLFGYRVDRIGSGNFRIISTYADSPDQFFNFRYTEAGALEMLESEYSSEVAEMIRTHLTHDNSLPVFLSALTMELYSKTTIVS